MQIRKTSIDDLNKVMEIYDNARLFMRKNGNPNQWIKGYPGEELIKYDINSGYSYVNVDNDQIIGVFTFMQTSEPTYLTIYEGSWLNDESYGVVHRIASVASRKGVATYCLNWCLDICKNLKIDTHRDNLVMQSLLMKLDFTYCGIIYLEDGSERMAYQKKMGR